MVMTEHPTINLWLIAEVRHDRPEVLFFVTDAPKGRMNECNKFTTLREASDFYHEVRVAGSWHEYRENHPNKKKRAKTRF